MKLRTLYLVFSLLICLSALQAKTLTGKVVRVKDGDTIVILKGKTTYTIRLDGIDCPEKKQAFGEKARQFCSAQVFGKQVKVEYKSKDRYQRILGTVFYGNGKNLNQDLLRAGLAWHYKHYNNDPYLAKLEIQARKQRKGLWVDKKTIPPWEFRRQKRSKGKFFHDSDRSNR